MVETSTSPGLARPPNSGTDVYSDAGEVCAANLAFSGVETATHLDTDPAGFIRNGLGAPHGPPRAVERSQEPIAEGFDLSPSESVDLPTHRPIMAVQEVPPGAVA